MSESSPLGRPVVRVDAYAKASGAQRYPSDQTSGGMLWVQVLRPPHPHARIVSIDTSAAAALMDAPFEPETVLRAGEIAQDECRPIDDIRSTAAYRRALVRGLLIRGLWPYLESGDE